MNKNKKNKNKKPNEAIDYLSSIDGINETAGTNKNKKNQTNDFAH